MRTRGAVTVQLLDELDKVAVPHVLARLAQMSIAPGQRGFSLPASAVLEQSREDASRHPFAIFAGGLEACDVVGIGVLQPEGADEHLWPSRRAHVLLRGFSIDAAWQGQGIGTDATREVVALTQRRFPAAAALVLTVHVDNVIGQRTYERAGFACTDVRVAGRTGEEHVLARPSSAAETPHRRQFRSC